MAAEPVDYVSVNRANWNERAAAHAASPDYCFENYVKDPNFIGNIVQFDRPLLGDVSRLDIVHLQCHIATDSLSLARLGAASVTGLDFSGASLVEARRLADATKGSGGEKLKFVEATVYDALKVLPPSSYDMVFTGIGALCWLHSISEWANVVAGLLKPGGRLFIRESHPVIWTLDDEVPDHLSIKYPYFERSEPTIYQGSGTYVKTNGKVFASTKSAEFNHGLGEIVQALLDAGMRITGLKEHDTIPWDAAPKQMSQVSNGEYQLTDRSWRLPHTYTLQAVKERS